jgi:hypothetical protein
MNSKGAASGTERDEKGRFPPGVSGNPAGKKKGTRNRATRLDEMLGEGTNAQVLEKAVEIAMDGDVQLLNRFVDRTLPKPRGETIRLVLPEGTPPGDPVALYNAAYISLANGELTIDQALGVCKFIEFREVALDGYHRKRDLEYYGNKIPGDEAFQGYVWPGPEEGSQPSAVSSQLEIPQPVVAPPGSDLQGPDPDDGTFSDQEVAEFWDAVGRWKPGDPIDLGRSRQEDPKPAAAASAASPASGLQIQEAEPESCQLSAVSSQPEGPEPAPASALHIKAPAVPAAPSQEPIANGQQLPSTPRPFVPDPALPGRRRSIHRQRAAFEQQQQANSPEAR